jgi:hypothetical protein
MECELEKCIHCEQPLVGSKTWHVRKTVQTLEGPLFVAGKSKQCANLDCSHFGEHYHASGVLRISLPYSTFYVVAFVKLLVDRRTGRTDPVRSFCLTR